MSKDIRSGNGRDEQLRDAQQVTKDANRARKAAEKAAME